MFPATKFFAFARRVRLYGVCLISTDAVMSDKPVIDLNYIGRALDRLTTDVGGMREDVSVLTAIALRLDATVTGLLTEVRAMHSQHARLAKRVRDLEPQG
jgi:hypothetical protein